MLNAEDGGKRRCILVTNNEVSSDESEKMTKAGLAQGMPEWEMRGICRAVTWPRTVSSIKGTREGELSIEGEYVTAFTFDKTRQRNFYMVPVLGLGRQATQGAILSDDHNGDTLSIQQKKQIVALIGKDKMPQSAVASDMDYVADEKYPASILFDIRKENEYLEALRENDHVTDIYIVAPNNRIFKQIKDRINKEIGDIILSEQLKIPISDGFKANAAFFRLGFLDKTSVALGEQFSALLPLLWLKAGGKGPCPLIDTAQPIDFYIFPDNGFAVLKDERRFRVFRKELKVHPGIRTAYLITDSESSFQGMTARLPGIRTFQLYRDYLNNFRINQGDAQ